MISSQRLNKMEWFDFSHIQRERPAPSFRLESSQGESVVLSDYRGRKNLVLFFLVELDCSWCRAALQNFADRQREYQERVAQVLVVVSGPAAQLALEEAEAYPSPVLADPEGTARQAYAAILPAPVRDNEPLVFVLDRYGAPYAALICPEPGDPTLQREILEWLDFIEFQCPE